MCPFLIVKKLKPPNENRDDVEIAALVFHLSSNLELFQFELK